MSVYWLIFLVVGVAIIGFIFVQERTRRRTRRLLEGTTKVKRIRLGWKSEEYQGEYLGWAFRFLVVAQKNVTTTKITFAIRNPTGRSFSLNEDGSYREEESFGAPVFKSNDAIFDKRFVFKTHSQEFAREFFSSARLRERLLSLKTADIGLNGRELRFRLLDDIELIGPAQALLILEILADIATLVDGLEQGHFYKAVSTTS